MPKSQLGDMIGGVVVIIAIFGILYMLKDPLTGVVLIGVCGLLIFLRAFIDKNS